MSVEELLNSHAYSERFLGTRNVNCGILRRIGKSLALKTMIRDSTVRNVMVLVPNQNFRQVYYEIVRLFEQTQKRFSLCIVRNTDIYQQQTMFLRGLLTYNDTVHIYADEVPNAELIVSGAGNNRAVFIAGFYSQYALEDREGRSDRFRGSSLYDRQQRFRGYEHEYLQQPLLNPRERRQVERNMDEISRRIHDMSRSALGSETSLIQIQLTPSQG